ncbi:MAG TPA: hypothetical protein VEA41_18870 [Salinarimonas sp.]|nr:hypothetical protein [Salinarimonas sp.]
MKDIRAVLNDPEFQALPEPERLKVWASLDPDFAGLPGAEQIKVLRATSGPTPPQNPASEAATTGAAGRFIEGVKEMVDPSPLIDLVKNAPAALGSMQIKRPEEATPEQRARLAEDPFARAGRGVWNLSGAAEIVRKAREGNLAGAAGNVTGAALPFAISKLRARLPIQSNVNAPQAAAIALADRRGVPLDLAQRSQNPVVKGVKAAQEWIPFVGGKGAAFRDVQEASFGRTAKSLASEISPLGTPYRLVAGERLAVDMRGKAIAFKSEVDEAKKTLVELAEKHRTTIEVGKTAAPSPLGPFGADIEVPVTKDIAGAVDYAPIRDSYKAVLERAEALLPLEQKTQNPGLALLRQIASRPDKVPLEVALEDLSEAKAQAGYINKIARTKSQGKAAFGVGPLQEAIEATLKDLGPEAQRAFKTYNEKTVLKHTAARVLKNVDRPGGQGPVGLVNKLTAPDDLNVMTLRDVEKVSPEALAQVGSTWLSESLERAGKNSIGWQGAYSKFLKLGPETKAKLFAGKAQEVEDLLKLGAIIQENPNISGSGKVGAITAAGLYVVRNPRRGALYILSARQVAKVMFSRDGARILTEGLRFPLLDRGADVLAGAIIANAGIREAQR